MTAQYNENTELENTPQYLKLLSEGLQEAGSQLEKGDLKIIAAKVKMRTHTVSPYFKGKIDSRETGIKILNATRAFILEVENKIKKAVA